MISLLSILIAAITAAAAGTLVTVIAWRELANPLLLNDDFMPAVSVGDAVCLIAGARAAGRCWLYRPGPGTAGPPAVAGGLTAFFANVIIL